MQKVARPIDLDRGNFCFRIKRRQRPVARRQSKACESFTDKRNGLLLRSPPQLPPALVTSLGASRPLRRFRQRIRSLPAIRLFGSIGLRFPCFSRQPAVSSVADSPRISSVFAFSATSSCSSTLAEFFRGRLASRPRRADLAGLTLAFLAQGGLR